MTALREFLGRDHDLACRRRVFRIHDALETEEASFLRIERTRVYFDDILLITRHRQRGVLFLLFNGLFAGAFLLGTLVAWSSDVPPGAVYAFLVLASPFVLAFLIRVILGVDVITVYGRRTTARMKFGFRKGRAREVYRALALDIRSRQQAASAPGNPPAAPTEALPPPPPAPQPPEGPRVEPPAPGMA